ncbi:hypothetical protein A5792_29715 [Mycolicibacterium peregrinum]|uniref:Heavy metal-binding domain-containing protein n=2 Tax=Mycolicibacterium peregrinum TaxID=43304 RepID=A0A1A0QRI1_MYCPR|nr:hypothetical protein A5792_29715 [Mycolicibacterium peregrinum]
MRAPSRLGLYVAALVAIFGAGFAGARAFIPADASASWKRQTEATQMDHGALHNGHNGSASSTEMPGLSIERSGYQIRDVSAPDVVGADGTLSFRLTGPGGVALTEYDTAHDKDLHLIVVRTDGAEFRHVHPNNDGDGRWSMPWRWDAAGSYRVFADAVPTDLGSNVTLTSTTSVAGNLVPRPLPAESAVATVGDFTVTLDGSLGVGASSTLTFTVTRAGRPVQTLEPYLGAYGHLVALRTGDLGYLHVHPMGEPGDGITQPGPDIEFMAAAPTDGTYLLYLDFKVDGRVHTAEFAVTARAAASGNADSPEYGHTGAGH